MTAQMMRKYGSPTFRGALPPGLGAALAIGRRRSGMSYRVAGARLGIAYGYLCELEHGRRRPSRVVAELLIQGYQLDAATSAWLLSEASSTTGRCSPYREQNRTRFSTE